VIVEGDTVATRWTWKGTHGRQGKLIPVPAAGEMHSVTGMTMAHMVAGKAVEEWEHQDWLGCMQQLGLVPQAGEG
jgi:predicted ester cyclase